MFLYQQVLSQSSEAQSISYSNLNTAETLRRIGALRHIEILRNFQLTLSQNHFLEEAGKSTPHRDKETLVHSRHPNSIGKSNIIGQSRKDLRDSLRND